MKKGDWKSLEKIRKLFRVSRNQSVAILNKARNYGKTYLEAYRELIRTQKMPEIWNEKIEKSTDPTKSAQSSDKK